MVSTSTGSTPQLQAPLDVVTEVPIEEKVEVVELPVEEELKSVKLSVEKHAESRLSLSDYFFF